MCTAAASVPWSSSTAKGRFVASWGEEVLKDAHGIFIDDRDQIWCVERETHCVRQFTRDGELLMTLGTPDQEGAEGEPFRLPYRLGARR